MGWIALVVVRLGLFVVLGGTPGVRAFRFSAAAGHYRRSVRPSKSKAAVLSPRSMRHRFQPPGRRRNCLSVLFSTGNDSADQSTATAGPSSTDATTHQRRKMGCYYRAAKNGRWRERLKLNDLAVGQELDDCCVVQELLDGAKTGPKVWCDCGVGRYNSSKDRWSIVNAMLRLDRNKLSVARKRAARLRKKKSFVAYVSRVRVETGEFEISLDPPQAEREKRLSLSSLKSGQEVAGKVIRVEDYGVLIDVGANHHGLLPIQHVADLYGHYIDKRKGLEDAGLERGARLRLQVASNEGRKRLKLDFTDQVKEQAKLEGEERQQQKQNRKNDRRQQVSSQQGSRQATASKSNDRGVSEDEAAAWAANNSGTMGQDDKEEDDDYEDTEDYDEDRDIEDALGLGTY